MYTIAIKDGKATRTTWDSDKRAYVTTPIESIVPYLTCSLTIEDTTFGQFFAFIEHDLEFYEKAYRSSTYGFPLKPYVDELHKPTEKKLDIDFLEVYWSAEVDETEIRVKEGPREWSPRNERVFEIHPCFHGWGSWDNPSSGMPGKGGIAIEFTPLNQMKDLPLELDLKFEVYEDFKPIWKSKKLFEVHDVIRAILYELTWAGDPSQGRDWPFDEADKAGVAKAE